MEKKYILSKETVRNIFSGDTEVPQAFVDNTAITNAVAIPVADIPNLQRKYGLYKLENISVENNTTGSVRCDDKFASLMETRKNNTFANRVENAGDWNHDWWGWLIVSVIATLLCVFLFTPMAHKQAILNKQINTASELAKSGEWKTNRYIEAERPGPLKINLKDWEESYKAQKLNDSLNNRIGAIQAKTDTIVHDMINALQKDTLPYTNLINKYCDSINKVVNPQAQKILTESRRKMNENAGGEGPNSYLLQDLEKEKKRATAMLQSRDSSIEVFKITIASHVKMIVTERQKQIDSVKSATENAVNEIKKGMSSIQPYKYDLLHPDEYTKSSGAILAWITKWAGILCFIIFLGCVVYTLVQLPKKGKSENQKYTRTNLLVMAFPGFSSSTNSSAKCSVSFFNVSGRTIEKLVSVRMRYNWHALCHPNSFEFNGELHDHEKLTPDERNNAFQPIFYAIEGKVAIIYSGLDKQLTDEDLSPTKEVVI